jgi:hypothetical protein
VLSLARTGELLDVLECAEDLGRGSEGSGRLLTSFNCLGPERVPGLGAAGPELKDAIFLGWTLSEAGVLLSITASSSGRVS